MGFHLARVVVPSVPSSKRLNAKVLIRVREYLAPFAGGLPADIVERVANDVMLSRFGYGSTEGKRIAQDAIAWVTREMETERAKSVHVALQKPVAMHAAFNQVREIKPRTHCQKRADSRRRKGEQIGEHNENRFHILMIGLTRILSTSLPSRIRGAVASRSEHYDPLHGTTDRECRDHNGDDVSLELVISSGATKLVIYDVKSSYEKADRFNADIVLYGPRQKAASLKKAIVVNIRRRDEEVVLEVIDDLVRVGLVPRDARLDLLSQTVS